MIFATLTFTQLRIPIFHFTKHTDVEIQICEEISIPQFIIYISEVRRKNFAFSLKLVTLKIDREREGERERKYCNLPSDLYPALHPEKLFIG